jgi:hypothetical protein
MPQLVPRLADYIRKPPGYYTDTDLECYFTSTNWEWALQDVSARDILEIQAMDEVAERGGLEDNRLSRSDSRGY